MHVLKMHKPFPIISESLRSAFDPPLEFLMPSMYVCWDGGCMHGCFLGLNILCLLNQLPSWIAVMF